MLFIHPTSEKGWEGADERLYAELISEVKMIPVYKDGIVENFNFFTQKFEGFFPRGAIFRADIYSYGKSADYVAKYLLKTLQGQYLWGPGEITPAMCSMENLSVVPNVQRKDIAILSVGNSSEVNSAFEGCENILIKEKAEYEKDYYSFVKKFKMWCGKIEFEPDFPGCHGGGDSSMYLTFVAGWWEIAKKYNFLFVSVENHQFVTATEVVEVIEGLKKRYNIDERRIYATGFSMGSGKTWDLYQEYPREGREYLL